MGAAQETHFHSLSSSVNHRLSTMQRLPVEIQLLGILPSGRGTGIGCLDPLDKTALRWRE